MSRSVFLMLDGAGVGALPDSGEYGDAGSDTLGNLSRVVDLHLPYLESLGLGNIVPLIGVPPTGRPECLLGRLAPASTGKDTTVGHWEHMGLVTARPFPTYPNGFPKEVLGPFSHTIGREVLGNIPASGTAIIADLGAEHQRSGKPIVYTSADSVFQIAAHVDVVPLEQLYEWCQIARDILQGPHAVARVIARPFTGLPGAFVRTKDRRDYSLPPPGPTYLDLLGEAGIPVVAVGKISEIFVGRGITAHVKVASNADNLACVLDLLRDDSKETVYPNGLMFTNLVDFDMVWGHRNDSDGFARGLALVDAALPEIVRALGPEDQLIISADHGVDPTTPSTDHSREYVPLLVYPCRTGARRAVYEGSFADTGATVYAHLTGREPPLAGNPVNQGRPSRGWRRYTPIQTPPGGAGPALPGRVGPEEARSAARWLQSRFGRAPDVAVVLGSGLDRAFERAKVSMVPYGEVPHWRVGAVQGHPQMLYLVEDEHGGRAIFLKGRIHGYEGFDLSEIQLQVRTLATWGVRRLLVTSASGAVRADLGPGSLVIARNILDFQFPLPEGGPARIESTGPRLAAEASRRYGSGQDLVVGLHASVPGPQYETPAELGLLSGMGVFTVSMSGVAEVRAAREEGLESAMICLVTNAGPPAHAEVLSTAARSIRAFTGAVAAVLACWGLPENPPPGT